MTMKCIAPLNSNLMHTCDTSEKPKREIYFFKIGRMIKQRRRFLISNREMYKLYREILKLQIGRFAQK